jgi:outer membrane protein TolC
MMAKSVNFDEVLKLSLQNNLELKAKKTDTEKAKQSYLEADGSNFGVLKFNENVSRTNHAGYVFGTKMAQRNASFADFGFDQFLSNMPGLVAQTTQPSTVLGIEPNKLNNPEAITNYESKLSYDLPIFTGWKITNAKKMTQLQIQANEFRYKADEKALSLEVLKAYNGAVAAKQFIKATNSAKEATQKFISFATEMHKEGFITQIDVKQAQVYDLDVDAKIAEAGANFELAIAYLRFLSGDNEIKDVNQLQYFTAQNTKLDLIQNDAMQNRDDLKWMSLNKQTAQANVDYTKGDMLPMIGMHVEYGFNDNNFAKLNSENDYYLIAGGLEYKIFDGQMRNRQVEKARLDAIKASNYEQYMQNGIKLEVEKNMITFETKQKIVTQKQKALELATDVKTKTEELYQNKLTTMTNLLLQEANLEKSKAELIMAQYDEALAGANLKISIGKSLENEGVNK